MNEDDFVFPVICLDPHFLSVEQTYTSLTTATKSAIKNGMFRDLLIVDSMGNCVDIKDAVKIHGTGFLWGYNIFFNQTIKIRLIPKNESYKLPFQDIQSKVLQVLRRNRHFWQAGGNFKELVQSVSNAQQVTDIINVFSEPC